MTGRQARATGIGSMAGLGLMLVLAGMALARDNVGQVVEVSGQVAYLSAQTKAPGNAAAFMKIAPGDSFTLAQDAVVRLVYFDSEREETWTGPGAFTVGPAAGQGRDGFSPQLNLPQRKDQASTIKDLPTEDLTKGGFIQIRGPKKKEPAAQ